MILTVTVHPWHEETSVAEKHTNTDQSWIKLCWWR